MSTSPTAPLPIKAARSRSVARRENGILTETPSNTPSSSQVPVIDSHLSTRAVEAIL
ncbi:hypothetical protein Slin15195_G129310 [Septoria linicola]|uniref:Uncharacterized protein n=1 Tax=Septoria linicola TaxID=215465 RepID=A0A9Q9ER77_9PEZI|nr:hypothetical protein Slin14017_G121840 [Septoria linicola]USW59612.1 hypothetical protein Slin15195_G129310 [Septoria linicola]